MKRADLRIEKSLYDLNRAENRRKLKYAERVWVEETPKINILNYVWYRYFTNDFINFILSERFKEKIMKKKQMKDDNG